MDSPLVFQSQIKIQYRLGKKLKKLKQPKKLYVHCLWCYQVAIRYPLVKREVLGETEGPSKRGKTPERQRVRELTYEREE